MQQSRNRWKNKSIKNGNAERYERKEKFRIKKERDKYKKEARETKILLEKELRKKNTQVAVIDKKSSIYIALQLFLVARIGFRAVSRVLTILGHYMGITKPPCTQTIINWVIRLSITRIQCAVELSVPMIESDSFTNGFIWMIDASIGLGSGKILAIVALDAKHHDQNEGAATLQQVKCIAVSVASSWTGETIADFLQKVIACTGRPTAYLKDGGTDLGKAIRLLNERGYPNHSIDDISHAIANLLKHEYQNHPMFETFISACGKVSKKLKQTLLACIVPPKVSTKARFMNINRLVEWADKILKHSPKGPAPKNSLLAKLRVSLTQIPKCRPFIKRFLRDSNPLLECQKILKAKGLNDNTYKECQRLVETIPARSPVRIGFINWAEKQLMLAENIGLDKIGMPISSDNIESLFGVAKQHGTGEIKDANRIALRIPAMCGVLTTKDAQRVLEFSVKEQQEIESPLFSLIEQRRQVLPNPGCLEDIQQKKNETKKNLELIPKSKNRSNNLINVNFSDRYENPGGPIVVQKKQARLPHKVQFARAVGG